MSQEREQVIESLAKPIQITTPIHQTQYLLDEEWKASDVIWEVQYDIPVPLLDERWLLDEANPQGEDLLIEGWLVGYQQHFTQPEASIIAQRHEVSRPLLPQTARMMAYVTLADEYLSRRNGHERSIASAEQELKSSREEINSRARTKKITKGKAEQERKALEKTRRANVEPHVHSRKHVQEIVKLISRKFILEQFTQSDNSDDFRLSPINFRDVMAEVMNLPHAPEMTIAFLDEVTQTLERSEDSYLLRHYRYKNHDGLTKDLDDTSVLSTALSLALDENTTDPAQAIPCQKLGRSLLRFIGMQGEYQAKNAQLFPNTPYPILSRYYDTLNAAMSLPQIYEYQEKLGPLLAETQGSQLTSKAAALELRHIARLFGNDVGSLYQTHVHSIVNLARPTFDKIPKKIIDFLKSDTNRIMEGLMASMAGLFDMRKHKGLFTTPKEINKFYQVMESQFALTEGIIDAYLMIHVDLLLLTHLIPLSYLGIHMNLPNNISALLLGQPHVSSADLSNYPHLVPDQKQTVSMLQQPRVLQATFRKSIEELMRTTRHLEGLGVSHEYLHSDGVEYLRHHAQYYLSPPLQERSEATHQMTTESRQLWHAILNTSRWFVSPRGDTFRAEDDTELQAIDLEEMTFRIDPAYPREHRVIIKLAGVDEPISLWLDTHQRLLNQNHEQVSLEPTYKLALMNLILKRLLFITSGVLSQPKNLRDPKVVYPKGINFRYQRAHYDVLKNSRYTMTSDIAHSHAQDIYEEYGIDIFAERDRRRLLGVIEPTDHLSFSREVNPDVMPVVPTPNIIEYDQDKLDKYIREHATGMME